MAGLVSPTASASDAEDGDHAAPDEPAPQRDLVLGLLVRDRGHRRDRARRARAGLMAETTRHADADHEAHDHRAGLEDERARRQA